MGKGLSQAKRARQNEKRRLRNRIYRSRVKNATKKLLALLEEKKKEEALVQLKNVISLIDKAKSKGVFHKNKASRKISRITKLVNRYLGLK